jgi:hypothetical protein
MASRQHSLRVKEKLASLSSYDIARLLQYWTDQCPMKISVYGLGRFPVTLYKEQRQKLLSMSDDIKAFISENEDRLKAKEKG